MYPWRAFENVVLHAVNTATPWPEEAAFLVPALEQPLPEWVYYVGQPRFICDPSLAAELKGLGPVIPSSDSSTLQCQFLSSDMLHKIFDTVLCNTALLRSTMLVEPDMPPDAISKTSLLAGLRCIRFLIYECWVLLAQSRSYEPQYVLPRDPKVPHNPLAKFTRHVDKASLIVCTRPVELPAGQSDRSNSPEPTGSSYDSRGEVSSGTETPPRQWEPWELDFPERMARYFPVEESDESEEDSTAEREDPLLNRHLLAAATPSDNVILLFLCMREGDRVLELLVSALYQRLACGVKAPLVGLTYHYGSPMIQLLVAWLADENTLDGHLPPLHVAYEAASGPVQPSSFFNMCNPADALRLASFLLSLKEHASHLHELSTNGSGTAPGEILAWRSDFISAEDSDNDLKNTDTAISAWTEGVAGGFEI
ncbi:hypothetical protein GLOTRDRAFT_134561 [Gloeophyllum trabeum ATCC 11539]|uniref:Uncharacterized protein n=1 Tax=Gloeophyllum trabeum (strain ATCC 11539 / FP-39264 / Madison 617) TaxID=670483 RepID=S7RBQ5_GLOTA|nr:uncharacterized protein GLOTRDRAFT_134561 [Gloeophyllum trabeum ATCC 11539]EPQ49829.1 hypothetical protein GLOTRDRAFT_134561 [Gloeophyllum trabeum ATCC 11539]